MNCSWRVIFRYQVQDHILSYETYVVLTYESAVKVTMDYHCHCIVHNHTVQSPKTGSPVVSTHSSTLDVFVNCGQ